MPLLHEERAINVIMSLHKRNAPSISHHHSTPTTAIYPPRDEATKWPSLITDCALWAH